MHYPHDPVQNHEDAEESLCVWSRDSAQKQWSVATGCPPNVQWRNRDDYCAAQQTVGLRRLHDEKHAGRWAKTPEWMIDGEVQQ